MVNRSADWNRPPGSERKKVHGKVRIESASQLSIVNEKRNARKSIPRGTSDASSTPKKRLARRAPLKNNANRKNHRPLTLLKDEQQGLSCDVNVLCDCKSALTTTLPLPRFNWVTCWCEICALSRQVCDIVANSDPTSENGGVWLY